MASSRRSPHWAWIIPATVLGSAILVDILRGAWHEIAIACGLTFLLFGSFWLYEHGRGRWWLG